MQPKLASPAQSTGRETNGHCRTFNSAAAGVKMACPLAVRASAEVRDVCVLGCGCCGDSAFCEFKLSGVKMAISRYGANGA